MAGPKLDGAGNVKIVTIHEAQTILQRCHGLVELMAMDVKAGRPITGGVSQLKRAATRAGGGDQARVRTMCEYIGSLRQQLEIAEKQILEKHRVDDHKHPAESAAE